MRACLIVCISLTLIGCRDAGTESAKAPPPPDRKQQARLTAARDALVSRLGARLAEAMPEGPEAAIAVCAQEAVPITQTVAAEHGVQMGRTSHRLRNPTNTPPPWAAELLAELPNESVFLSGPDGQARALLPITLEDRCVICHGSDEQIPEPIRVALDKHYPADAARGFAPGDIRGYVWVESE